MNKAGVFSVLALVFLDAAASAPLRPLLSPPPFVPAVPGKTCEIYFRSVTDAVRPESYGYDVRCAVGRNDGTAWRWTPTEADAGRKIPLVISLVSDLGVLSTATTRVQVARLPADRKHPLTLALLADSLTNCLYQDRLLDNMREAGFSGYRPVGSRTGYSASPVGTFAPGKAAHEGYGGYSRRGFLNTYAYTTDEIDNLQSEAERRQLEKDGVKIEPGKEWRRHLLKSPLLKMVKGKKTVDIQGWFDRIDGGRAPDVILVALGGNDVFLREDNGRNYKGEDVLGQVRRNADVVSTSMGSSNASTSHAYTSMLLVP